MAITAAGSFTSFGTTGSGTTTTIAHTAVAIGNVVMAATLNQDTTITVTSMTGGGCTTWTKVAGPHTTTSVNSMEIWAGVVTATGSSPVVAHWSASVASSYIELDVQEFTAGLGATCTWARDGTQEGFKDNAASTTLTYPTLTPSTAGELYYGHGYGNSTAPSSGSTPGVTYVLDTSSDSIVYAVNVTAAITPTAPFSTSQTSGTIGVLMIASVPGGGASPKGGFFPFMA
jgi:hypothetical protein